MAGPTIIDSNLPNTGPAGTGIVNRNNPTVKTAGSSTVINEVSLGSPSDLLIDNGITDGSVGPLDGIGFVTGTSVGAPDQIRKGYAREITPGNPIAQLGIVQKAPVYSREVIMNISGMKQLNDGRWFDPGTDAVIAEFSTSGDYAQVTAGQNDRSIRGRGYGQRYFYKRQGSVTTEILDAQTQ